jgi:hypothetical protein
VNPISPRKICGGEGQQGAEPIVPIISGVSDPGGVFSLVAATSYLLILLLLVPFGVHRVLTIFRRFSRPQRQVAAGWTGPLPRVTVQLPVYNEANVVERLIDAACQLDYPRHLLDIQLLDDSTDETTAIAAVCAARWRRRGVRLEHIRRPTRVGYKAGALSYGLRRAPGEFLLVLDADFVPQPELVRRLLVPFSDERVGMVQAAWRYLNEGASWLTRAQALLLDAHFQIEHEARFRAHLFFNFNGTAGMWRRACVERAGGWQATTLTEDLDLSYRAQLAGWRFVFLPKLRVPSELPGEMAGVEVQQERWTQGGVQTARILLPRIWKSSFSFPIKAEATAHLLGHAIHPVTLSLAVALGAVGLGGMGREWLPSWLHVMGLAAVTLPFVTFVGLAGAMSGVRPVRLPRRVLEAMALAIGLGVPLTGAVIRGAFLRETPFVRTPKRGVRTVRRYRARCRVAPARLRALLGILLAGAVAALFVRGAVATALLTGLFAAGYLASTWETLRADRVEGEQQEEGSVNDERKPGRLGPDARRLKGVETPISKEDCAAQRQPGTAAA